MQVTLQELLSTLASEAAEQETAESNAVTMEEDELERTKLPKYIARFKVSRCAVPTHFLKF